MVENQPTVKLNGQSSFRLVNSKFPPVTLFDDVLDAEDFDTAFALQALTNPRILNELGDINLVSMDEVPFGIDGVNYATAPFTHVNPEGSRFSDGSFGVLYVANTVETAIAETRYHQERYFRNVEGLSFDTIDMRCLKVQFTAELVDAVNIQDIHIPDDYSTSRMLGEQIKNAGLAGLQYGSVRNEGNMCWGLMSPRYVESVIQTQHFEYVYDGQSITKVRELTRN